MSLNYSITRQLMRHAKFYNEQILPFFNATPRFAIQAYCLRDDKTLFDAITSSSYSTSNHNNNNSKSNFRFLTMQEIIRGNKEEKSGTVAAMKKKNNNNDHQQHGVVINNSTQKNVTTLSMSALRLLSCWKKRIAATSYFSSIQNNNNRGCVKRNKLTNMSCNNNGRSSSSSTSSNSFFNLPSSKYKFEIGDIVQHSELNHIGVVAAKMPICFETDEWIEENLGSANDYRLSHPWYLILVARHDPLPFDFVRYGSQLTHVKGPCEPIGCHRMLPMFFSGFDSTSGRYIPRETKINEIVSATMKRRQIKEEKKNQKQQVQRKLLSSSSSSSSSGPIVINGPISVGSTSSRRSTAISREDEHADGKRNQQQRSLSRTISSSPSAATRGLRPPQSNSSVSSQRRQASLSLGNKFHQQTQTSTNGGRI